MEPQRQERGHKGSVTSLAPLSPFPPLRPAALRRQVLLPPLAVLLGRTTSGQSGRRSLLGLLALPLLLLFLDGSFHSRSW